MIDTELLSRIIKTKIDQKRLAISLTDCNCDQLDEEDIAFGYTCYNCYEAGA